MHERPVKLLLSWGFHSNMITGSCDHWMGKETSAFRSKRRAGGALRALAHGLLPAPRGGTQFAASAKWADDRELGPRAPR